jgi:hypothetical protein
LRWGLVFFLAVALYFLLMEHRAHLFAALPWLLLLSCPLMHFFMHRWWRNLDLQPVTRAVGKVVGEDRVATCERVHWSWSSK